MQQFYKKQDSHQKTIAMRGVNECSSVVNPSQKLPFQNLIHSLLNEITFLPGQISNPMSLLHVLPQKLLLKYAPATFYGKSLMILNIISISHQLFSQHSFWEYRFIKSHKLHMTEVSQSNQYVQEAKIFSVRIMILGRKKKLVKPQANCTT